IQELKLSSMFCCRKACSPNGGGPGTPLRLSCLERLAQSRDRQGAVGLHRSLTVAALTVAARDEACSIFTIKPAPLGSSPFYVGIDVGGTSTKGGVVDDNGRPQSAVSLPTEAQRGQEFGLERMCETIRQAIAAAGVGQEQIAAIGVATPGTMDIPAGVIL